MNAHLCVREFVFSLQDIFYIPEVIILPFNFKRNFKKKCFYELGIDDVCHPDVLVSSPTSAMAYSKVLTEVVHHRYLYSIHEKAKTLYSLFNKKNSKR